MERFQGVQRTISEVNSQLRHIKEAINRTNADQASMIKEVKSIEAKIREIQLKLNGDAVAGTLDLDRPPSISRRAGSIMFEAFNSTSSPTKTHQDSYAIAVEEFKPLLSKVKELVNKDMKALQDKLGEAGSPYTPYSLPEFSEN